MIHVEELHKAYAETIAVEELSFDVQEGQIFGLLGPNGAGKSTTIGCMSGLVQPTRGRIRIGDHDLARQPKAAKREIGVVPQEIALYEDLSAWENLRFFAGLHDLYGKAFEARAHELLAAVGLEDRAKEPIKQFSGGMQRRLNFACGIVHHPRVLFCDEPTVGVDPQSRVHLLDLVRAERDRGTAVIYTTHYMEEAEQLCDALLIVDHGRAIARGTIDELRSQVGERDLLQLSGHFVNGVEPNEAAVDRAAIEALGYELVSVEPQRIQLTGAEAARRLGDLLAHVKTTSFQLEATNLLRPSLESLFIKLTGRELRE